jgi:similar to stage IV sporulation protein
VSILKLRYVFTGYLVLSVEGMSREKLINLAIRQGIGLWDIEHGVERTVLSTDVDSFFDLRHLAKKTGCRLRIVRKAGLPFLQSRLSRRRGLVLGLAFFVLTLYTLSSFVLFVRVEGNERLDEGYILQLAANAGARPGVAKSSLDKDGVANRLILSEPQLAWVGIHVRGTRLIIEVVENIEEPEMDKPGHVVAMKDGLVYDILVITGEPTVQPGDTVTRGQVLIEGKLRSQIAVPQGEDPAEGVREVAVRARGEVWARVWYEGYGEAALQEVERTRTGKSVLVWTLMVDGQPVLRVGRSHVPYPEYEQETANKPLLERILRFPVEIITETSYEVERHTLKLTPEQAWELAAERARILAEFQLPVGVMVESTSVEDVELNRDGFVGVRYVLETKENIAKEEEIPGGD